MESFNCTGPIGNLVQRLDSLRSDLTLIKIASALEAARLTPSDVAAYVRETSRSYHRAVVVRREQYELLVLTWLPGQGSAPHDHAGSVSAMMVLQAEAAVGCWRIAADGYADLQYETVVRPGELSVWQDAGVHTVRNGSKIGEALVTVHVYAPPLRDFRRFAARPNISDANDPAREAPDSKTVVIIGGGFSGAMTAAQVLHRANGLPIHVVMVDRQGTIGEGLAYSTRDPSHLLNVPASRMSAWPDRPNDFVDWVSRRKTLPGAGDFLPRQWYGEYVRESLLATARESAGSARLSVVFDEARRIARRPNGGWVVHFARGPSLAAEAVVLAVGHRPPSEPSSFSWSGSRERFIADPWQAFATNAIGPDQPVVILGSGLTAVDAVMSLSDEVRRAPITLLSRRGLKPQPHLSSPLSPDDLQTLVSDLLAVPGGVRAKKLLHELRQRARTVADAGRDWRSVIDGLRPHTALLWQSMPLAERRKFVTRLRPFWEVHRHRMALAVARRFAELEHQGLVRIVAGRIVSARADEEGVLVHYRERGNERICDIQASWVLNCTGPTASNSAESNPAIGSLLVHGWIRRDELGLGLDTTLEGDVIQANGAVVPDMFVVGTLRKPSLWESTAVPELRNQAAAVADRLLTCLQQ